jgi:hypothetical protein
LLVSDWLIFEGNAFYHFNVTPLWPPVFFNRITQFLILSPNHSIWIEVLMNPFHRVRYVISILTSGAYKAHQTQRNSRPSRDRRPPRDGIRKVSWISIKCLFNSLTYQGFSSSFLRCIISASNHATFDCYKPALLPRAGAEYTLL